MNTKIKVTIKTQYGNQRIFVVSEHKEALRKLTGRETVTQSDIEALKALGYTFEVEQAEIKL